MHRNNNLAVLEDASVAAVAAKGQEHSGFGSVEPNLLCGLKKKKKKMMMMMLKE